MLTKTDRWGEKKGQCGESETGREKQMAAERILLGAAGSVESQKMSAEGGHREREGGAEKDGEEAIAHLQIYHLLGQDSLERDYILTTKRLETETDDEKKKTLSLRAH